MKKLIIFLSVCILGACASLPLPTSSEYVARGEGYHRDGKLEKAVKSFDKAVKINPGNAAAYASRGAAYFYMQDYEKASEDFIKAIDIDPANVAAYSALGASMAALGENEKALFFISKALENKPDNPESLLSRGSIFFAMEMYSDAVRDFSRVIELRPCVDAFIARAEAFKALGYNDYAEIDIQSAKSGRYPMHLNSLVNY
ncbi:Putatively involved in type II secretion system [Elusimicrobium minutum Pei191]|uniref:Putatively involved in type II secretion system n=1 Tax=Elusimicrobium minutum (strain Pei191) TaxID=445932 RepID=B2KC59_ELUMP|nr:tetratricopeptide repeat protein [Elusimicrobium minutum]ACC98186.1 Putatively involved in type II secretion system [Elusimicrobium minutum Pei191]